MPLIEGWPGGSRNTRRGGGPTRAIDGPRSLIGSAPATMDLTSIKVAKLTPEERQRCMNEGLCLRYREKGHLAKDCPQCQRN